MTLPDYFAVASALPKYAPSSIQDATTNITIWSPPATPSSQDTTDRVLQVLLASPITSTDLNATLNTIRVELQGQLLRNPDFVLVLDDATLYPPNKVVAPPSSPTYAMVNNIASMIREIRLVVQPMA